MRWEVRRGEAECQVVSMMGGLLATPGVRCTQLKRLIFYGYSGTKSYVFVLLSAVNQLRPRRTRRTRRTHPFREVIANHLDPIGPKKLGELARKHL